MSDTKRPRGRPLGTGLDDSPTLRRVADMVTADPKLRPTTAIKRILDKPSETTVRRLQGKWKVQKAAYLEDARRRHAAASARSQRPSHAARNMGDWFEARRQSRERLNSAMPNIEARMNSPAVTRARELILGTHRTTLARAVEDLSGDRASRMIREAIENPAARAMREIQQSPTVRAIDEAHRIMRQLTGF